MSAPPELSRPPDAFDLLGPLPTGTTVLEASAGTGKTYTIAGLVTRYVAEGVARLDDLLVITFGRMASQELRERVRGQLVAAGAALADPAGVPAGEALLAPPRATSAPPSSHARRRRMRGGPGRLRRRDHRHHPPVLPARAALAGRRRRHRRRHHPGREPRRPGRRGGRRPLPAGVRPAPPSRRRSTAPPRCGSPGPPCATPRRALAPGRRRPAGSAAASGCSSPTLVRAELDRRKRRLGILCYDDLLSRLADALEPADSPAAQRMRQRWRIVLVDEFQDTDPVQWQVLERAFHGHATLVLIGDPKQAIYAFRGGDVVTYLAGARARRRRSTRCRPTTAATPPLVDALQVLTRGAALGDPADHRAPHRTRHHAGSRLAGAPQPGAAPGAAAAGAGLPQRREDTSPSASFGAGSPTTSPTTSPRLLSHGATFADGRTASARATWRF